MSAHNPFLSSPTTQMASYYHSPALQYCLHKWTTAYVLTWNRAVVLQENLDESESYFPYVDENGVKKITLEAVHVLRVYEQMVHFHTFFCTARNDVQGCTRMYTQRCTPEPLCLFWFSLRLSSCSMKTLSGCASDNTKSQTQEVTYAFGKIHTDNNDNTSGLNNNNVFLNLF